MYKYSLFFLKEIVQNGSKNLNGNLMILEADINVQVSNHELTEKQTGFYRSGRRSVRKKGYTDSTLRLPRSLAKTSKWSKWEPVEIDRRQKILARLAIRVWKI